MDKISAVFETSSNTTRLKTRNDQFNGEVAAKAIKLNKDFYKNLNFYINNKANKSYHEGKNVRHPKFKVPAFYGMTTKMKEQLSKFGGSFVSAYETKWLRTEVKKYITANL